MAKWRLAESLKTLRAQLDAAYPSRSKKSDGSIGDAAHSARASDHNPNRTGVVCAIDITHDPANGLDCNRLADALTAARDPRVKYLIWNGRITQKTNPGAWKKYAGSNPHRHHLHISVKSDPVLYDSKEPWALSLGAGRPVQTEPQLRRGDRGPAVVSLQAKLAAHGYPLPAHDGAFGAQTEQAVKAFQRDRGLEADGIVGRRTIAALNAKAPA